MFVSHLSVITSSCQTLLCNRTSGIYILTEFSEKKVTRPTNTTLPLYVRPLFFLFETYTNDAYWVSFGNVKVAPGWLKLKISPGTGEARFSLGEGKKIHWVCYRGVLSKNLSAVKFGV